MPSQTLFGPAVLCRTPAKINIFLHITGRRADGYHLLQSVMRSVSLFDEIKLRCRHDGQISRSAGPVQIPAAQDLCVRAAQRLQLHTGCKLGVDIALVKRIPTGAGLGGGSSNAAAVLNMLNTLWQLQLPIAELEKIGLALGADVPFFIRGGDQWVEGIGEVLQPIALERSFYVVLFPDVHCPTAELFADPELQRDCAVLTKVPRAHAAYFEADFGNVFEGLALRRFPEIAKAHAWLRAQAGLARLSGSGSALFAPIASRRTAMQIAASCPAPWRAWYVHALAPDQAVRGDP
jgi:4-diphosphocytidyl-2-C-methyl-D-erythritol kinase